MDDDFQSSEQSACPAPLRIATIGISPDACFHLEAAAIRDQLIPVAAARSGDDDGTEAAPVPGCSICSVEELSERSDVDAVFVCGPVEKRIEHSIQLLQSGRHVIVEPSFSFQPEQLQRLICEAKSSDRLCEIWRPRNADTDFRRAAKVVSSGEAGTVRSLRFLQHDMAAAIIPQLPLAENTPASRDRLTNFTLRDLAAHRIAQVLTLITTPVKNVSASFRRDPLVLGERGSVRPITPEGDTGFHAVIEFEDGASAIVDIGLACPAPFSTGWVVQGNQGGYHSGRQYITVDDGEIYDVAVDVEPFDPYRNLHSVVRGWASPEVQKECLKRLQAESELAGVLQSFL